MTDDVTENTVVAEQVTEEQATQEPVQSESVWPDNWREAYAGEDESKLSIMSRYASPMAALDGLVAAKQKISSGEYKADTPFPEKGTDEEKTEWRTRNGIPSDPTDYKFTHKLSDEDKDFVEGFAKYAHDNNIPQASADSFMGFLLAMEQQEDEAAQAEIQQFAQQAEDKLRAEWGNNYRRNMGVIEGFMNTAPESVQKSLMGALTPEGMPLIKEPEFLKWMASKALEINPMPSLVVAGGDQSKGIQTRINEIEKTMREDSRSYYKDEAMQEEYRNLLDARDRMSKSA